jgi:hypothetical protein
VLEAMAGSGKLAKRLPAFSKDRARSTVYRAILIKGGMIARCDIFCNNASMATDASGNATQRGLVALQNPVRQNS